MKALYSLLVTIGLLLFFVFGLPWLTAFIDRHAMTLIYVGAGIALLVVWALVHGSFFSDSDK